MALSKGSKQPICQTANPPQPFGASQPGKIISGILLLLALAFLPAAATPAHAVQNTIGTATITTGTCNKDGLAGGTCYRVVISNCPEATSEFAAGIKINQPPNASLLQGTVFFTTGGGGDEYYDYDSDYMGDSSCPGSNCGLMAVQNINAANYRTVQVNFTDPENRIKEGSGWLTGHVTDGPRALACRYTTLVHAVWTILLDSDATHAVCATGNSGGGALIAYAITQYGMGTLRGPAPCSPWSNPPPARPTGASITAAPAPRLPR